VSNIQREDIGPLELAEALQEQLDEDGDVRSQAELAEAIGKDKTWVSAMLRTLTLPRHLRERVGTSQLSLRWESVERIARVGEAQLQEELVDELLGGATHQEIRNSIQDRAGKGEGVTTRRGRTAKPRRLLHTTHGAKVIVQSETTDPLGSDRIVAALRAALEVAHSLKA